MNEETDVLRAQVTHSTAPRWQQRQDLKQVLCAYPAFSTVFFCTLLAILEKYLFLPVIKAIPLVSLL